MQIGICGTHCAGKTTLARALALEYDLPLIEEVAARYRESDRQRIETQFEILDNQIDAEMSMDGAFVSDRTVVDNWAYLHWHAMRNYGTGVTLGASATALSRVATHMRHHGYDAIIFVDEYFPPEENGVRSLDVIQQEFVYHTLKIHLPMIIDRCCPKVPYLSVRGSTGVRLDRIDVFLDDATDRIAPRIG